MSDQDIHYGRTALLKLDMLQIQMDELTTMVKTLITELVDEESEHYQRVRQECTEAGFLWFKNRKRCVTPDYAEHMGWQLSGGE